MTKVIYKDKSKLSEAEAKKYAKEGIMVLDEAFKPQAARPQPQKASDDADK